MTGSWTLPAFSVALVAVARVVFGTTWTKAGFSGCILGLLFWLVVRSESRLERVERCLGSDRE